MRQRVQPRIRFPQAGTSRSRPSTRWIPGPGSECRPVRSCQADLKRIRNAANCPRSTPESPHDMLNPEPPTRPHHPHAGPEGCAALPAQLAAEHEYARGLGEPDVWRLELIGASSTMDLDVQVARSDWYEKSSRNSGSAAISSRRCTFRSRLHSGVHRSSIYRNHFDNDFCQSHGLEPA